MSDEEKKAIVELNHFSNMTAYWKQEEYTNSEIDNYIKIVLNLNEKQSKEIEELKYKYSDEKIRNTIIKRYREVIEKDYVSKDKIKSKIDYLLKHYDSENFINFEMFIKILQSLLEKE